MINSAVTFSQTLPPVPESVPTPASAASFLVLDRAVVLVGLMGAGKTRVGRRLAEKLGIRFIDTDHEIEGETGKTISELFTAIGEPAFRDGERRMIARILGGPVAIVAAGGGAFMDRETRARIREQALAIWLRADLDTLVARTARSNRRPLLEGVDRAVKLAELMAARHPIYAEADLVVDSIPGPIEHTVDAVIAALRRHRERS